MFHLKLMTLFGLMVSVFVAVTPVIAADGRAKAQAIVEAASKSLTHFVEDPNMTWFRDNLQTASALLIAPKQIKAGFGLGGSGGTGVLLARDAKTGMWSQPAFYTMGAASIGLQAGVQVSEVSLLVRNQKGLDAFLSTKFQLGGDISVAAGPVGAGVQVATVDILSFARTQGIFGGLSLEGAAIAPRHQLNHAYYGRELRPVDILIRRDVKNDHAAELVAALNQASKANK